MSKYNYVNLSTDDLRKFMSRQFLGDYSDSPYIKLTFEQCQHWALGLFEIWRKTSGGKEIVT